VASAPARRYAKALFELAQENGQSEHWERHLRILHELFAMPEVRGIVANPALSPQRRLQVIDTLNPDSLGTEGRNLAKLLIESGLTGAVEEISQEFERLVDAAAGRIQATATTAVKLDDGEQGRLARELSDQLGHDLKVKFQVDSAILGGLILRLGDRLIDASLRGRLRQLRQQLA
jgi:F-type H+-transporting ATPase subunit delta